MKQIRSQENISKFGEVFTPTKTIVDILNQFPEEVWTNPKYVFLEHSCGNGNFIIEIFKKRVLSGISIEQAINTIFGLDISEQNIIECHNRLYKLIQLILKNDILKSIEVMKIVKHNIFVVEDSIKFLQNNWKDYPFFLDTSKAYQEKVKNKIKKDVLSFYRAHPEKLIFQEFYEDRDNK